MPTTAVIVIPTYNERANVAALFQQIAQVKKRLPTIRLKVLVVDDSSPDGTGELVEQYQKKYRWIHLLVGKKSGLGTAYKRGIRYALTSLAADVVVQMDADLSHDPEYLPALILQATQTPNRFVIGSRYVAGGGLAADWPWHRRLISRIANLLARYVAALYPVQDCTAGYKAINATLLQSIDWEDVFASGYCFQMSLLHTALKKGAEVVEVPIVFYDRTEGESKMRLKDVVEFAVMSFLLGMDTVQTVISSWLSGILGKLVMTTFVAMMFGLGGMVAFGVITPPMFGWIIFTMITLFIIFQSIFTLIGMMYAWEEPLRVEKNRSPRTYESPQHSFSVFIPALHEEEVIADTIRAAAALDYPEELKEVFVICRWDDQVTIRTAEATIKSLGKEHIRLLIPPFTPRNKPDKLNYALRFANNEVVCVFDAEDSPHQDILQVVNTVMVRDRVDVVQSGVQLVNYRSTWFSTLNVLEYFFWFKSVLHFFADREFIPLGGNTVFIKKNWLKTVGGWDADCLTEDADLGVALSTAGARMRIIYDEVHATQEETPPTLNSFIKQRTRWNQGFLQVYKKGDWKRLPKVSQRFFIGYILLWPEIQALFFIFIAFSVFMMVFVKMPVVLALISVLPLYILLLSIIVLNIGLYEFAKKYHRFYPKWMPLKVLLTFIPYQFVLGYSAIRAIVREIKNNTTWEKTEHANAHRAPTKQVVTT